MTCGESESLTSEQITRKDSTERTTEEMPLNIDAPPKKGLCVCVHVCAMKYTVRYDRMKCECVTQCCSSLCLSQRRVSASVCCRGSSCGTCSGCQSCSSDTTSSSVPSTQCCSTWQMESHRWVNTHRKQWHHVLTDWCAHKRSSLMNYPPLKFAAEAAADMD